MGMKLQQRSTHIPMGMKVQQRSTFRFFFTTSKNINIIRNEIPILELVQQMGAIMLSESYTTTVAYRKSRWKPSVVAMTAVPSNISVVGRRHHLQP
eukprot:scaffold1000_cov252-Chaetoceros_neogracile.AAC.8